jgi:hypothetical protein
MIQHASRAVRRQRDATVNLQNADFNVQGINGVPLRGMVFKVMIASPKDHNEQGQVKRRIRVLRDMLQ